MSKESPTIGQGYAIDRWGEGYFAINDKGHLFARPNPRSPTEIDLRYLASELKDSGIAWPILVRFTDILQNRVETLCDRFSDALAEHAYSGQHMAIYPIKVNQQRTVIEKILHGNRNRVGLEAGSKPELMAVLSMTPRDGVIVCNGYKDREYIRLALIGQKMGHRVFLVVEKPNELTAILREAADIGIDPLLGVRIRTAIAAASKWQNTGGEKAKFGLNASQIVAMVNELKSANKLHCLQLLHAHLGSQIPDINDLQSGMREVSHYFAELQQLGAHIRIIDVGGGLGIDYEGTKSRNFCSVNYSLADYARIVVGTLSHVCAERDLPYPDIFTESGRAMTAHHAMLITNVIEQEYAPDGSDIPPNTPEDETIDSHLASLEQLIGQIDPRHIYEEARRRLREKQMTFCDGQLSLGQRAAAERAFFQLCRALRNSIPAGDGTHQELLDELHGILADKLFLNFSLFQSTPDSWGIGQIFPVVPLHRLNESCDGHAVIHDMTCDSDGTIEQYVEHNGVRHTLPVSREHPGDPYLFGIFLIGAYQETLGDLHNLFGDTNTVDIVLDEHGSFQLTEVEFGDSVNELLSYLHFSPHKMLFSYREKLRASGMPAEEADKYYNELDSGLHGYTYHED